MVGSNLEVDTQEAWRRKMHTPESKRVRQKKHLKAQGTCPHMCLLEQIWATKNLGRFQSQARRRRPAGFGEVRSSIFEMRFSLLDGNLEKNPESVRRRNGSDEIWPKVRKVKEGSMYLQKKLGFPWSGSRILRLLEQMLRASFKIHQKCIKSTQKTIDLNAE